MSNKQRTIIIMRPEDNKANSLIHKLKKNPHKLLLETIGETIPERIHKLNIDLLILFHIENFPQICKEIKDSPFLRDVPVLIFDNKPSEKRQLMAYKSGASDYIFEPILEETITLKVQNFLNTSQSIRQLESELSLSKFDKALNKLLEQELLLFSQIVEQSANSIMVTDLEGKIKFINTSFTDVTGYTFNEIIGKNSRILKSGKTPPGIYVDLWDTIKSGKIWSGELLNRKKNGELIWESVNITPLKDQNGITNNYLAINMDITEKKKYEEQIRESEESFRALSESQFEGIIVHKNNIILEINFAITSLFGYERDELFGSNLSTLFTKESYRKLLKEKAEESYELEGIRKDGSIFPLEIRAKDIPYMGSIVRIAAIRDITKLKTAMKEIQEQKNKLVESYLEAESLLLNILPEKVVTELRNHNVYDPVYYPSVSVMFSDFQNFTSLSEKMSPMELLVLLNMYFTEFDDIAEAKGLEKLKTIGDSFMCAGGIPEENQTHAIDCVLAGLEFMQHTEYMKEIRQEQGHPFWEMRLGIHTGPLVAGLVGSKKFAYDVWGDTVNTASRMENSGEIGKVNISGTTYDLVKDFFVCEYRGKIEVKNKKDGIEMYFVKGIKPELSFKGKMQRPNKEFKELYDKLKNTQKAEEE